MLKIDGLIYDVSPMGIIVDIIEKDNVYYISMTKTIDLNWEKYWESYLKFCRYFLSKYYHYKSYEESSNVITFEIGSVFDILYKPEILKENTVNHTR